MTGAIIGGKRLPAPAVPGAPAVPAAPAIIYYQELGNFKLIYYNCCVLPCGGTVTPVAPAFLAASTAAAADVAEAVELACAVLEAFAAASAAA